jgi:dolichol-phosphate mannosyltransferase
VHAVVVVPTYQEAGNIVRFLHEVRAALPDGHIVIVDDNSPDGTGALADEVAAELGNIRVLHRASKAGLGSAYRHGFSVVLEEGYDAIVSMDCDFSHSPAVIPAMLARLEQGADTVIGSRYVPGGGTRNWPLHRRVLSRWGNRYTSFVLGLGIRDCTAGFRAYRASALRSIDPTSTAAEGYTFLTELMRRLILGNFKVVEHPIMFVDREVGTSKMSGRIVVESMLLVTRWGVQDLWARMRGKARVSH